MTHVPAEDAIAAADAANEGYAARLKELEILRSSSEGSLPGSDDWQHVTFGPRLRATIEALDATIAAAEEARGAEDAAIRLNFKFLAQSEKIHESSRLWYELIRQYTSEREALLTQEANEAASGGRSSVPRTLSPPDRRASPPVQSAEDSTAGTFCLVGGALVAVGTFFPYFVATFGVVSISRNAFQLGQNLSMTYQGPLILVTGLLLFLRGLTLKGVIESNTTRPWSPLEWSPLTLSIIAAIAVLDAWLASFPPNSEVTFNRGFGGIVSLIGVLSGFVAMYVHRRNLR
jgi:hypothetical protein